MTRRFELRLTQDLDLLALDQVEIDLGAEAGLVAGMHHAVLIDLDVLDQAVLLRFVWQDSLRTALASLPGNRTPNERDWRNLATFWRPRIEAQIGILELLRDRLDGCIGCGCLSLKTCELANTNDVAASRGAGPRYVLDAD